MTAKASRPKASIPNAVKPQAEIDLAELQRLHDAGSSGDWYVQSQSLGRRGDSLFITSWWRERENGDGTICTVSTEHWRSREKRNRDDSGIERKEVKNAANDAKLIVAAVNALPELIRRAGFDGNEVAWLIEWPADDYGPIRYWAAGHSRPVIDPNKATRFARKQDATAVMGAYAEKGAKVHEHMWMRPAIAMEAREGPDRETGLDGEAATARACKASPDV